MEMSGFFHKHTNRFCRRSLSVFDHFVGLELKELSPSSWSVVDDQIPCKLLVFGP